MLNIFPIQFLAPLTYLLLRVVIGTLFIYVGSSYWRRNRDSLPHTVGAFLLTLIGVLFVLGLTTQIAALGGFLTGFVSLFLYRHSPNLVVFNRKTALLVCAISISLFVTGAGPFGFDLPI